MRYTIGRSRLLSVTTVTAALALRFLSCSGVAATQSPGNDHHNATTTMDSTGNPIEWKKAESIYDFTAKDIKGDDVKLDKYRGHVAIVVNVASDCGYTKNNYKELSELYEKYADSKGLRILAFPCNQFGGQEPGDSEQIVCFARERNVRFDMFQKVDVNGNDAHPLWSYLKHKQGGTLGSFIKWNFTKFIVDKNGQPVERHGPSTDPKSLEKNLANYW